MYPAECHCSSTSCALTLLVGPKVPKTLNCSHIKSVQHTDVMSGQCTPYLRFWCHTLTAVVTTCWQSYSDVMSIFGVSTYNQIPLLCVIWRSPVLSPHMDTPYQALLQTSACRVDLTYMQLTSVILLQVPQMRKATSRAARRLWAGLARRRGKNQEQMNLLQVRLMVRQMASAVMMTTLLCVNISCCTFLLQWCVSLWQTCMLSCTSCQAAGIADSVETKQVAPIPNLVGLQWEPKHSYKISLAQ